MICVARPGREPGTTPNLTPETQEKICKAIAQGTPQEDAAAAVGVTGRTLRSWKRKGLDGVADIYTSFASALKKAEAECLVANVEVINKAAMGHDITITKITNKTDGSKVIETTNKREFDWCAAAWMLERRYPEKFALRHKKEIEAAVEAAIEKRVKDGLLKSNDRPDGEKKTEEPAPHIIDDGSGK
jgi:hypothetical protein